MQNLQITNPTPITLEQLLIAREQRQERQNQLLQQYHCPLISLTINMPGKYKLTHDSYLLFNEAVSAIETLIRKEKWLILHQYLHAPITGCEGFWVIADHEAIEIKRSLIELEQQHQLGRLWDIDVFDPHTGIAISRKMLSIEPRTCLICNRPAKACARSQQHTLQQLLKVIQDKLANYRHIHAIADE